MSTEQQKQQVEPWFDRRDFIGLVGIALVGYGAWLIYEPAGFIAPGVILACVAIFGVRR